MKAQESSAPGGELLPNMLYDSGMAQTAVSQQYKKAPAPKLGEAFGSRWNDQNLTWSSLPGGGVVGFDLNRLTLADFRMMRDHYQVNASLSVLSFMMHQLQWRVECDNDTIRRFCHENIEQMWTRMVRAFSQAFWAGYSPNVLQWDNDMSNRRVVLSKIKDLLPEEARVNWKTVEGWAPPGHGKPKLRVYDGIQIIGSGWPVPVDNTLWYPLLMENGDYYGKKLLRPAFTSWFFSIIMHLFSNRYFERFGEPVPVARAPYDEELDVDGSKVPGRQIMMSVLQALRNRSAVVLPDQRSVVGTETQYDYDIEYLESQMRGADFERYLMRLDEEISLALFTPLLMLRTADVGSYNLGTQHSLVYMQMLNALAGDWKEYMDHYVLGKMVDFNFGTNAKRATIKFRRLGDDRMDLVKTIMQQLIASGAGGPDLVELGEIAGMKLQEIQQITEPPAKPAPEPEGEPSTAAARKVAAQIYERMAPQIQKAFKDGRIDPNFKPSPGYQRQLADALGDTQTHGFIASWLSSFAGMEFGTHTEALEMIKRGIEMKVDQVCEGNQVETS
jgi:hypothetical protein